MGRAGRSTSSLVAIESPIAPGGNHVKTLENIPVGLPKKPMIRKAFPEMISPSNTDLLSLGFRDGTRTMSDAFLYHSHAMESRMFSKSHLIHLTARHTKCCFNGILGCHRCHEDKMHRVFGGTAPN